MNTKLFSPSPKIEQLPASRCYVTGDGVTGDRDTGDDIFGDIGDDSPFGTATFGMTARSGPVL